MSGIIKIPHYFHLKNDNYLKNLSRILQGKHFP